METVVLVTGGFDPLHSGHLAYLKAARKLGDKLIVGVNSDSWLERKKGKNFLSLNERFEIVSALKYVDNCILFNDCLLYTSPSPRDRTRSRMPSSA